MAEEEAEKGRLRIWPGVLAPVALSLLLAAAGFLFVSKVTAEQERSDAAALELERYARAEARRLADRSGQAARDFVSSRTAARDNQEKNLRLEARTVLDAVHRLLGKGLERADKALAGRREVGPLPRGFDGLRPFLEIPPPGARHDASLAALRAMGPELSDLLPAGCALTVVEDNSRELLSLGGTPADGSVAASLTRDFLFTDAGGGRHWSLRVELSAPDAHPAPDPAQLAQRLGEDLADVSLSGVAWRGWLLDAAGGVAAAFPPTPVSASAPPPPFIEKAGEWVVVDDTRLAWLERSGPSGIAWTPAVAVAIDRPGPPLILADEFWKDRKWSMTLGALALFTLAGWLWFARHVASGRREAAPFRAAPPPKRSGPTRQRLVRDPDYPIPEVQGVIVADIDDQGRVRLQAPLSPPQPPKPRVMPSGSLARLHALHRGREGRAGSGVLDQARSPVLRELAKRVRPAIPGPRAGADEVTAHAAASAKVAEKIAAMKSASGWKKVEE